MTFHTTIHDIPHTFLMLAEVKNIVCNLSIINGQTATAHRLHSELNMQKIRLAFTLRELFDIAHYDSI